MFTILNKYNLAKLFLLAIVLRLLLMPFYYHPDIKTYNYQSSYLKSGVFNIYKYLVDNNEKLPIKEEFVYFPLTYLFLGSYQVIMSPFLGADFNNWISDASAEFVNSVGSFRYLLILKLPFLILDLLIPFLLIKFISGDKEKRKAFIIWLFNPFSIVIIYIFSNIDIIPVALSLLSLIFFQKKRLIISGIFLGLAIGFKPYPIIFLPFLLLFLKKFREIITIIIAVLTTVGLIILPFWSSAFLHSALISNLTTRIAFPNINIGFGEALMITIVSLAALFFSGLTIKNLQLKSVWRYIFTVLLVMFSSIHFHIQWLLWIMPYVIIFHLKEDNSKLIWVWISLACIIPILYNDRSMNIALLSAISPLYILLPTPFKVIEKLYDPNAVSGVIHSVLLGAALVIVWKNYKKSNI